MRLGWLFIVCIITSPILAQQVIPLYSGAIPNAKAVANEEYSDANQNVFKVQTPTLTIYKPKQPNGTAVVICPGGGYGTLVIKREGYEVAELFNKMGVTAFVLKYRLPSDRIMVDKSIGPLQDAQQAIKLVRQRATEWQIDPNKIGIMGFSAGGHLAATAATHFTRNLIDNSERISVRPDFAILIYPVISLHDSLAHGGSRKNLLGDSPSAEQIRQYSNEQQVTKQTPATLLFHAEDDSKVPVQNSLIFYQALLRNGVQAGMHLYPKGEHGFLKAPPRDEWMALCQQWLKMCGFLPQ